MNMDALLKSALNVEIALFAKDKRSGLITL